MSPVQPILALPSPVAAEAALGRGRPAARREADAGAAAFLLALAPAMTAAAAVPGGSAVPAGAPAAASWPAPAPATTAAAAVPGGSAVPAEAPAASTPSFAAAELPVASATMPAVPAPLPATTPVPLPATTPVSLLAATPKPPSSSPSADVTLARDALAAGRRAADEVPANDPAPFAVRGARARTQPYPAGLEPTPATATTSPDVAPPPARPVPAAPVTPVAAAVAAVVAAETSPAPARETPVAARTDAAAARPQSPHPARVAAAAPPAGPDARSGESRDRGGEPALRGRSRQPSVRVEDAAVPAPAEPAAAAVAMPSPVAPAAPARPAVAGGAEVPLTAPSAPLPAEPAARPAAAMSHVTLDLSDGQGMEGRLRVALRGNVVRATIVARDPEEARELQSGLGELRGALGERGFPDARLAVQGAAEARAGEARAERDGQHARQQEDHAGHPGGRRDGDLDSSQGDPRRRSSRRQAER